MDILMILLVFLQVLQFFVIIAAAIVIPLCVIVAVEEYRLQRKEDQEDRELAAQREREKAQLRLKKEDEAWVDHLFGPLYAEGPDESWVDEFHAKIHPKNN